MSNTKTQRKPLKEDLINSIDKHQAIGGVTLLTYQTEDGRDGFRLAVENLEADGLRKLLCLAIMHNELRECDGDEIINIEE